MLDCNYIEVHNHDHFEIHERKYCYIEVVDYNCNRVRNHDRFEIRKYKYYCMGFGGEDCNRNWAYIRALFENRKHRYYYIVAVVVEVCIDNLEQGQARCIRWDRY